MLSKQLKALIYIVILILVVNLIPPLCSYAIDEDSIYVWSNSSSAVSTSNTPDAENEKDNNSNQEQSR